MVKFVNIQKLFPKESWDVGFITAEQLKICAYKPVKWKFQISGLDYTNDLHYKKLRNCFIFVRQSSISFDYSLYQEVADILDENKITGWYPIYTNFKEAQILAGLGVRAKNSLVYNYQFGFDSKVCAIGFDEEIIDPPTNKRINTRYWKRCEGCDDCANACPVGAIHNKKEPYWLDSEACDNFICLSDHPTVPSMKKFWHKYVHPEKSQEEVDSMNNYLEDGYLPWDQNGFSATYGSVMKDDEHIGVPMCRECQVQPRCSKWNGKYPYEVEEAKNIKLFGK